MQAPATQRPDAEMEMTDELLISAYMDGDHQDHPEGIFTQQGLQTWEIYHLIGDTLRSSELGFVGQASLSQNISLAIESEPIMSVASQPVRSTSAPLPAPAPLKQAGLMKRVGWPTLAMAAAVASVVWVARPFFVPAQSITPAQQVAAADPVKPMDPSAVNDYLQAHRQLSGPAAVRQVSFTPGNSR